MKPYSTLLLTILFSSAFSFSFSQPLKARMLWEETSSAGTLKFTADGSRLVTGSGSYENCYPYVCGQIKIWRVADSTLLKTITHPQMGNTNDVDISPDDQTIISGNGSVYCAGEGGCSADKPGQFKYSINGNLQKSLKNPGGNVYAIAYSPDGSVIASGTGYNNNGDIRIYDKNFILLRVLSGHQYTTTGLVFTPDGNYLISGGDDGLVKVWNYKTGALIRTLVHGTYLDGGWDVDVDVSPDGQYFASAGQGYNTTVKLWRTSDGQLLKTFLTISTDGYNTVRFTPNGRYVVAGTIQYGSRGLGYFGRILVWSVADGKLVKEIVDKEGSPQSGGIRTIGFSPVVNNGYYFAYGVSDKLKVERIDAVSSIADFTVSHQPPVTDAASSNSSAFPNPFYTGTTIQYTIPAAQFVSITVFRADGRQVATLVNAQKDAGTYQVRFDAGNLTAGVYFYKFTTGSFSEVRKIILSK